MDNSRKGPGKLRLVHMTFDCYNVPADMLRDEIRILDVLKSAATSSRLIIVGEGMKRFPNGGLTAFLILSQSHISVHTWPEREYAAFDIFTCDSRSLKIVEKTLRSAFPSANWEISTIERGRKLRGPVLTE